MLGEKEFIKQAKVLLLLVAVSMCILMLNGCGKNKLLTDSEMGETSVQNKTENQESIDNKLDIMETGTESQVECEEVVNNQLSIDEMTKKMVSEMTIDEKVYQMFIILPEQLTGVGQVTAAGETTREALEKYPVGGILYLSQNLISRQQTVTMLSNVQSYSKIPVFTAVDEEGGIVSRVGNNSEMGTTSFPSMQTIGDNEDVNQAYAVGNTIGSECGELGFNLDFAPVADVFSNPENTVIGERAFSSDVNITADMVYSCVSGFKNANMLCTLKHYPGHGDTIADSHYEVASTSKTLEELMESEFVPFKKGIQAGADFVMVGHILTPNITDSQTPSTLSREMISILRNDLKFDGVVITDAMNMAAITEYYSSSEATVAAINAGVDMILVPEDFHAAVEGVIQALENGNVTEAEIDDSVFRIIKTKITAGLITE